MAAVNKPSQPFDFNGPGNLPQASKHPASDGAAMAMEPVFRKIHSPLLNKIYILFKNNNPSKTTSLLENPLKSVVLIWLPRAVTWET